MGGNIDWKVQFFKLNYDKRELDAVRDTLESGWITMGQRTIDFENAYSSYLGEDAKCLAVANGTAALHIAVQSLGLQPDDEVIVPSYTFIADLNVVSITGAKIVLADIVSKTDLTMDPDDIKRKITEKTKAVLIVHYGGYSCDLDPILEICRENKLKLIEDCAHVPGGDYKGRKLGTFGDLSAWSFFTNKNLAVGEGGMVVTRDPELYEKCKYLRSHGMTVASFDRMKGRAATYDVVAPGFNYRIDEMRSALGLVQLNKLSESNESRRKLTERYFIELKKMENVIIPFLDYNLGTPTYHILPILLDEKINRSKVIELLKNDGIQTSIHYPSIQSFTAYKSIVNDTPLAQYVSDHEITLPLFPTMSFDQVDLVCNSLKKALEKSHI